MPTNNQEKWEERFRKEYPMVKDIDTNTIVSRGTYDGGYLNGHIVGVGHGLMAGFKFSKSFIRQEIRQAIKEILEDVGTGDIPDREERMKQCGEYAKGDENLDCAIGFEDGFDAGYSQAKAEIRERIKKIIE